MKLYKTTYSLRCFHNLSEKTAWEFVETNKPSWTLTLVAVSEIILSLFHFPKLMVILLYVMWLELIFQPLSLHMLKIVG